MAQNLKQNPSINKVHANKFRLDLPKISIISHIFDIYNLGFLNLTIKGTVAAGLRIEAQDVPGPAHKPFKLTGAGYTLEEIPVTFKIDGDFINYFLLWNWLNKIYDIKTGEGPVLDNDENPYEDFQILGLDNYNKPIVKFKYSGGFITSLSNIEVSYENSDNLEAQATFAYDDFSIELVT